MKKIRWTAIGTILLSIFTGLADLHAGTASSSVGVSATVKTSCIPATTKLGLGDRTLRITADGAGVSTASPGGGTVTISGTEASANRVRNSTCRVSFQQEATPVVEQGTQLITINY